MTLKDTATLNSPAQEPDAAVTPDPELSTGNTGNTEPEPENRENNIQAGGPPSGFYMYIGPNIKNLIRNGAIYRGDRAHALAEAKEAIEKFPLIKTLIVSGDYLPEARLKVKTPGNALYANYRKIVGR